MPNPVVVELPVSRRRRLNASKKRPSKRPKQVSLSRLKKQLEALQKLFVIRLYGIDCFTCTAKDLHGMNCQLGHVPWPRSDISVQARFDHRHTRIQCFRCNIHLGGCGAIALQRMIDEGVDVRLLRAESDSQKGKTVPRAWFEEKIAHYKALNDL